ncbi:MAG: virulence protein [Lachnospirales bacterium]
MKIKYNVKGAEKKKLVQALSEILGIKAQYLFAPSFSHKVGDFIVDAEGTVSSEVEIDIKLLYRIVDTLAEQGFIAENEIERQISEAQYDLLTVAMPKNDFTEQALKNLVDLIAQKRDLITKAFDIDNASILEDTQNNQILFPWFDCKTDAETIKAYTIFIEKFCKLAKSLKRVNSKENGTEITNEKYAFRCFLLRLGLIGNEYKVERKILLKNFEGSSAFKNGGQNELSE